MTIPDLPDDKTLNVICMIWRDLLGVEVLAADDVFDQGADSLLVVDFLAAARSHGIELRSADVFRNPTPGALAEVVRGADGGPQRPDRDPLHATAAQLRASCLSPWDAAAPDCLVPLVPEGSGAPLFLVHWGNGAVRRFAEVARDWSHGRPVYGFEAPGLRGDVWPLISVAELADRYLMELRRVQPDGPYHLAGICQGGMVAFEMARRLRESGPEVRILALVKPPTLDPFLDYGWGLDQIYEYRLESVRARFNLTGAEDLPTVLARMREQDWYEERTTAAELPRLQLVWAALAFSLHHYQPRRYDGRVVVFQDRDCADATARNWTAALADPVWVWFTYNVESALPIVHDARVAEVMRRELAP